jgi:hypothetical protein
LPDCIFIPKGWQRLAGRLSAAIPPDQANPEHTTPVGVAESSIKNGRPSNSHRPCERTHRKQVPCCHPSGMNQFPVPSTGGIAALNHPANGFEPSGFDLRAANMSRICGCPLPKVQKGVHPMSGGGRIVTLGVPRPATSGSRPCERRSTCPINSPFARPTSFGRWPWHPFFTPFRDARSTPADRMHPPKSSAKSSIETRGRSV